MDPGPSVIGTIEADEAHRSPESLPPKYRKLSRLQPELRRQRVIQTMLHQLLPQMLAVQRLNQKPASWWSLIVALGCP